MFCCIFSLLVFVGCSKVPLLGDKIAIRGNIECIAGGNGFWKLGNKTPSPGCLNSLIFFNL